MVVHELVHVRLDAGIVRDMGRGTVEFVDIQQFRDPGYE